MAVNKNQVVADMTLWLPTDNVLDETQMLRFVEGIISQVGSTDEKYPEVLCKSLRVVAQLNLAKGVGDTSGIKKQSTDDVEYEYFENSQSSWKDYLESLKDICPLFGYNGLSSKGLMRINPSPVTVNVDGSSFYDLHL